MNVTHTATDRRASATWERCCFASALLIAGYFLATSIYISGHRLFWHDEVYTILTTRMPDWQTMWRALVEDKSDRTPFGYFIVARIFDKLLGPAEIGIRLPSALAMTLGMLIVYDSFRRAADGLHGLIAMAMLSCTFLPYYGYEGRSYAIYFMFAAAVLWAWVGKRSPLVLGALFLLGVTFHFYLILCLVPFAAAEAWSWRPWRLPSARLAGGAAGAMLGLLLLLPQIRSSAHSTKWWTPIGLRQLPVIYSDIFPDGIFLLALLALWIASSRRTGRAAGDEMSAAERAGMWSLAIPIAGWIMARFVTHAYLHRYVIGMLPGVALGFSCLLWRQWGHQRRIGFGVFLILAVYGGANQAAKAWNAGYIQAAGLAQERTRALLAAEDDLRSKGKRFVVFDRQDIRYLEVRYYSKHPELYYWWYFPDPLPPVSLYYPIRHWSIREITEHGREVVLVDTPPTQLEELQRAGFRTTLHTYGEVILTFLE